MSKFDEHGMRVEDWLVFHEAAMHFGLWILVRWTNPRSLDYIGRASLRYRYIPKPIDCKPKTADRDSGRWEQAGLVVDPVSAPGAFRDPLKKESALKCWAGFLAGHGASSGRELNRINLTNRCSPLVRQHGMEEIRHFEETRGVTDERLLDVVRRSIPARAQERVYLVDTNPESRHYGCLTLNGAYIYGDYDLKDLIDRSRPEHIVAVSGELHGQPHMASFELVRVQQYVNDRIGIPMVQHADEVRYTGHSDDTIEVFGPGGETGTLVGEQEIERWYDHVWHRGTIDVKQQLGSGVILPPSRIHVATSPGGVVLSR